MSVNGSSKVNNRVAHSGKYTMSNHTVSWHYTLSNRMTSLTELALRERFTLKTNQASPSSMSLEKRVRIRPKGVVSKKCIGLQRIWRKSLSWRVEAAFTVHCQHKQHRNLNMKTDMSTNSFTKHTETIWTRINKQLDGNCQPLKGYKQVQ